MVPTKPSVEVPTQTPTVKTAKAAVGRKPAAPVPGEKVVTFRPNGGPIGVSGRPEPRRRQRGLTLVSILLFIALPTALVGYYYAFIASPQFLSETRFAVRGTDPSPLASLGFGAIPGASTDASDAYIVRDYISSTQILTDLKNDFGIDVRKFYASDDIDPLYRREENTPFELFHQYWNWVAASEYNSTTQITSFEVAAFSANDANKISSAVLAAAEKVVNELSSDAQQRLIATAVQEVSRTEERLARVSRRLTEFRNREQSLDPTQRAESEQLLIQGLQQELLELRARRAVLAESVDGSSPAVRVIERQIRTIEGQLEAQRREVGSGASEDTGERNLSFVLGDYAELQSEEGFARAAYTAALQQLETAQAEARKQQRYFAIVVNPTTPEVALYPRRIGNTLVAFAIFVVVYLIVYLVVQSIKDHAA